MQSFLLVGGQALQGGERDGREVAAVHHWASLTAGVGRLLPGAHGVLLGGAGDHGAALCASVKRQSSVWIIKRLSRRQVIVIALKAGRESSGAFRLVNILISRLGCFQL